ncbi:HD domain-containing protein [Sporosarcina contaminans]|uniref:HD domain-containing protein n=1 Tax=Sporosarcina contaminans TaxID=633403 RepID=A0ABW3TTV9_9BACL
MKETIQQCEHIVKTIYNNFDASHDFDHIDRVMKNAEKIMKTVEEVDEDIVRLSVLLHDIDDPKYQSESNMSAMEILKKIDLDDHLAADVMKTIESVSFSGGNEKEIVSIEGAIVRDADRLDAIGAIGIARTFAYGGAKGRKLYDAEEVARSSMSEAEYRSKKTASVTHFHEKLLLLKDLMVTDEGKRLAKERHNFMVSFLQQLENEIM